MKTKLAPIANQATGYWADIADTLPLDPGTRWEVLRDWLDTDTGSELDCVQLDILTAMLERRLRLLDA